MRFAIWQNTKWRLIDDASYGHNMVYSADEQIHTTSAAAAAALGRHFRTMLGHRLRRGFILIAGSSDMKGAYKQLAIRPDPFRFVIITTFHPIEQTWVFAISYALAFGLSGAVLHFNRAPSLITAFCRRWFVLPVQHFF